MSSSYGNGEGFCSSFNCFNYTKEPHQTPPPPIQQFQTNSWQDIAQPPFTQKVLSNCTNTDLNETAVAPSQCKCTQQSM